MALVNTIPKVPTLVPGMWQMLCNFMYVCVFKRRCDIEERAT